MFGRRKLTRPAKKDWERNKVLFHTDTKLAVRLLTNWERNRPPDPVRVDAILEHQKEVLYVPGIVYAFTRYSLLLCWKLMQTMSGA